MSRNIRQSKILSIIAEKAIETQEELVLELKSQGFVVTQATISRDIKELNLVKAAVGKNKYRYVVRTRADSDLMHKCINLLKDTVVSVVAANNLVVVKTVPNGASMVSGVVDQLALDGVLGVVGNGDAILIVTTSQETAAAVENKLKKLVF